jgi:glucose/arabinose dehydrogenase
MLLARRRASWIATIASASLAWSGVSTAPVHAQVVPAVTVEPIATGLEDPTGFTFATDGRIVYGERRTGEIRLLHPGISDTLLFKVPKVSPTNTGLMGVELHPSWPTKNIVFAYATRTIDGIDRDQLLRITPGTTPAVKVMLTVRAGPPGAHHGGRVLVGPDGKLYLLIGDEDDPATAQTRASNAGKVLRMTLNGAVPGGNPFPNSRVFASGIRNGIGFDFDPVSGRMWATENGPECNDELNRIVAGANYGWGATATCTTPPAAPVNTNLDGPSPVLPAYWEAEPTAPTGAAFCDRCGLGDEIEGALVYGEFVTGNLQVAQLSASRQGVDSVTTLTTNDLGILSVEAHPNGDLYFSDREGIYRVDLA